MFVLKSTHNSIIENLKTHYQQQIEFKDSVIANLKFDLEKLKESAPEFVPQTFKIELANNIQIEVIGDGYEDDGDGLLTVFMGEETVFKNSESCKYLFFTKKSLE